MSEDIYRGKSVGEDCWAYGAYSYDPVCERGFIVNVGIDRFGPIAHLIEVDPATKGQFTGLYDATQWEELTPEEQKIYKKKDWYGRMVFEGDILEAHYDAKHPEDATRTVVVWGEVDQFNPGIGWGIKQGRHHPDPLGEADMTWNRVIGNIHDNPELIEVSW